MQSRTTSFEFKIDAFYASTEREDEEWTNANKENPVPYIIEDMLKVLKNMNAFSSIPLKSNNTVIKLRFDNLVLSGILCMTRNVKEIRAIFNLVDDD